MLWTKKMMLISALVIFACFAIHLVNVAKLEYDGYLKPYPVAAQTCLSALSDTVQRNLQRLQNPANCTSAKKALCDLRLARAGFGSSMHYYAACLAVAYGLNRTMVISREPWVYSPGGWTDLFVPVGNCTDYNPLSVKGVDEVHADTVRVPFIPDTFGTREKLYPPAVPKLIGLQLDGVHRDPKAWWLGQTFKYLLRPIAPVQQRIETARLKMNLSMPYVGLHVRHTDKIGMDAEFHPLEDYMKHAEDFYKGMEPSQSPLERTIYLATDTEKIRKEAQTRYPQYKFVSANDFTPRRGRQRKTVEAIHDLFIDIFFLSHANHLVCTITSNVCRASYEIMQSLHEDATNMTRSLDGPHFFTYQDKYYQQALLPHRSTKRDEIDLQPGDQLLVIYYRFCRKDRGRVPWLGCQEQPLNHIYSRGRNLRTKKTGYYPKYKVKNIIQMGM